MRDLSHPNFAVSSFPAKNLVENPKKLAVTWGLGTRFLGVSMDLIMDFQTINMTFLGGKRKFWKRLKRLYKEEAKKPRHLQGISNSRARCPVHLEGISTKLAGASRSGARCSKVPPSWNSWVESFKTGVIRKVGSSAKKLRSQEAKAPLLCKL